LLLVLLFGHFVFVLSIRAQGQSYAATSISAISDADTNGWIEGKVTNAQGSPLAEIDLDLYQLPSGTRTSHTAATQTNGTFVLGPLAPGNYILRCDPNPLQGYARTYYPTSYFRDSAQPIPVTAGQRTTANFVLRSAGAISGQITEAGGSAGLAGIDVDVFDSAGNQLDVTARSDRSGKYVLGPVPVGSFFVLADPEVFDLRLEQYYSAATDLPSATSIAIVAGVTTSNINFALLPAGFISGVVRDSAGAPLDGIDLDAYAADTGERVARGAITDESGVYELGPLAPGRYLLRCDPEIAQGFALEYYSGKALRARADLITVEASSGTSNINFTLDPAASISGRVIAADSGLPLAGTGISVFETGSFARMDQSADTDAQGRFIIGPFPVGTYVLSANPDTLTNYTRTFFASTTDISAAEMIALAAPSVRTNVQVRVLRRVIGDVRLSLAQSAASTLSLSAAVASNQVVELESRPALSRGAWQSANFPRQNNSGTVTWQIPITTSNQFFRVRLP
jgi:hypothetical protein